MTHEEAELERDRRSEAEPDSTWLVTEQAPGDWAVARVGIKPTSGQTGETVEAHSQPNPAEDPRTAIRKNVGPEHV
jgi:hypothetical protein